MMVSVTGGLTAGRDPLVKSASHITSVPLYFDLAGMVSVDTRLPFSLVKPGVMSGNSPTGVLFTLQTMLASSDWCRHLNTASVSDPISSEVFIGYSANSTYTT